MHKSYWDQNKKELVNHALNDYCMNHDESPHFAGSSGIQILSYAKRGLLKVCVSVDPNLFSDWYPLDQGHIFLQLAKMGKLEYNESPTST